MPRKFLNIFSITLLLFNGIGAIYGGLKFIADPTGASMQLPLSLLAHSPFTDYLIPGIILLCANGILSIVVIALILSKSKIYPLAIIAQACILFGWTTIQTILIRNVSGLHIVFWIVAILLVTCGILLSRKFTSSSQKQ